MRHVRLAALALALSLPFVARAQTYDRATLHSTIEKSKIPVPFENLGSAACSFLTRENVANWNVSGGECRFVKFLNTPKHGKFIPTDKPGEFAFQPISLGKDVVRFLVESTASGRQAVISLHITVVEPEA